MNLLKRNNFYHPNTYDDYKFLFDFYEKKNFTKHGNKELWKDILLSLPAIESPIFKVEDGIINIGSKNDIGTKDFDKLKNLLLELSPWRNGPYNLFGIDIDSEWKSYMKWDRLKDNIPNLKNKNICDIGCNNGYHMMRALEASPNLIVGFDRTPLYIIQFLIFKYYLKHINNIFALPIPFEDYDVEEILFDIVFLFGVLYHKKNPFSFLNSIKEKMSSGGYIIIETLVSDSSRDIEIEKGKTYVGMHNIYTIYTEDNFISNLSEQDFINIKCIDRSKTYSIEQRSTEWMNSHSLENFMISDNQTIDGYDRPSRAIFIAQKK